MLLSRHFFYFGKEAPLIPQAPLKTIGFKNGRNYRVFDDKACVGLVDWLHSSFFYSLNCVAADPFDFEQSEKRYSAGDNRIT